MNSKRELLKILFGYQSNTEFFTNAFCYDPAYGILVYDKNEAIELYVEICFRCKKGYIYGNKSIFKSFCSTQFSELKSFVLDKMVN